MSCPDYNSAEWSFGISIARNSYSCEWLYFFTFFLKWDTLICCVAAIQTSTIAKQERRIQDSVLPLPLGLEMNAKKCFSLDLLLSALSFFGKVSLRRGRHLVSVIFSPGGPVQFGRTGHLGTKQSNVFLSVLSKSGLNCACREDRGLQVFLHPIYLPTRTHSYLCMNNVLKSHKKG